MKKIPLTQGKFALVDDIDYEYLMQWKWFAIKNGQTYYAGRRPQKGEKEWIDSDHRKTIHIHRIVLERKIGRKLKKDEFPDHISGDGLDNCRDNLRVVNHRMNMQNLHIEKSSKYPGVCFRKWDQKYQAGIQIDGKNKYLGCFSTQEEAYKVYCEACEIANSGNKKIIDKLMAPRKYSSKFKNVSWHKNSQKWQGDFCVGNKSYYVGLFSDEYEAHLAVENKRKEVLNG